MLVFAKKSFFLVLCFLLAVAALGEEASFTLGGSRYTLVAAQTANAGNFFTGVTADGGGIEVLAADISAVPRLYMREGTSGVCAIEAHQVTGEAVFTPALPGGALILDFIRLGSGVSMDAHIWDNCGELGISGDGNPLLVVSERPSPDGGAFICVLRGKTNGRTLSGECTLRHTSGGTVRLSSGSEGLTAMPVMNSENIFSAQWTYEVSSRKLSVSVESGAAVSGDIGYGLSVNGVSVMNKAGGKRISETVQAASAADEWRLRMEIPGFGVIQSPVYRVDGSVAVLTDGAVYTVSDEDAAAVKADYSSPTASSGVYALPTDGAAFAVTSHLIADFASSGTPSIQLGIDRLTFRYSVSSLPSGSRIDRVCFVQSGTKDGFFMDMRNAYEADGMFTADNVTSNISLTVYIKSASGTISAVPAGTFTLVAFDH